MVYWLVAPFRRGGGRVQFPPPAFFLFFIELVRLGLGVTLSIFFVADVGKRKGFREDYFFGVADTVKHRQIICTKNMMRPAGSGEKTPAGRGEKPPTKNEKTVDPESSKSRSYLVAIGKKLSTFFWTRTLSY